MYHEHQVHKHIFGLASSSKFGVRQEKRRMQIWHVIRVWCERSIRSQHIFDLCPSWHNHSDLGPAHKNVKLCFLVFAFCVHHLLNKISIGNYKLSHGKSYIQGIVACTATHFTRWMIRPKQGREEDFPIEQLWDNICIKMPPS